MQNSTGYGPRGRIYFDGHAESYEIWETRFINYLYTQDIGLHKAILPKVEGEQDDEDYATKNRKAYAELVQTIDERSLQLIMNDAKNDGRAALKVLRKHYASTEKPRVLTLYEELTTLRMAVNEDVTDYMIRAERAATGLRSAGETISDNLIIAMLLKGLPEAYKSFVVIHTQLDQVRELTEFKAALHNFANTESMRTTGQTASALSTTAAKRPVSKTKCNACGKGNHKSNECRSKAKLQCGYCGKQGHVESVCFKKKSANQNTPQSNTSANTSTTSDPSSFSFTVSTDIKTNDTVVLHASASSKSIKEKLLVDCGATCHIVNDASRFVSYDNSFDATKHYIELADGRCSNELAIAKGDAIYTIMNSNGKPCNITLTNALLAPKFPTSLFSVRAATDAGASVTFAKDIAQLTHGSTQFNIVKEGQLYFLPSGMYNSTTTHTATVRTLDEWHVVLGHMNHDDIISLGSITTGMVITQLKSKHACTTCKENKMTRLPKSSDDPPKYATKPLDRVHTDVCGPIEPASKEGYRYIINFIDEYSSMLFIYPLRTKDEAAQALKNFLADVAPIGRPKEIHSDNGGEYNCQAFQNILLDNSIKHTTTAPYSPYQNGKSERSWRI